MVGEENITLYTDVFAPILLEQLGWVVTLVQAVGIIFVLYIIYYIYSSLVTYKNRQRIIDIKDTLGRIEKKLDRVLRKKK
ncbi:MAG: nitrate/nitrite transporter NarK [Patescibacteria group bacterium]|jgi:nitrate/nitrite transporter NarK